MHKRIAAAALAATLVVGGAAGAAVLVPGVATAATAVTSAVAPPWMTDALNKLVGDGTINQSQADAVGHAIESAKPAHPQGRGGHDGPGGPGGKGAPNMEAVQSALGMTAEELHTALDGGQTIAQVAAAKGIEVQTVINAMVTAANSRIDEAVANGKITQAQADEKKADVVTRVTHMVNNLPPAAGDRRGPGPDGPPPAADSNQAPQTPDTTG
ncbi:MAG: hypothetical protein WCK41_01080 [Actinomycetes bacterium]